MEEIVNMMQEDHQYRAYHADLARYSEFVVDLATDEASQHMWINGSAKEMDQHTALLFLDDCLANHAAVFTNADHLGFTVTQHTEEGLQYLYKKLIGLYALRFHADFLSQYCSGSIPSRLKALDAEPVITQKLLESPGVPDGVIAKNLEQKICVERDQRFKANRQSGITWAATIGRRFS
jgi:hypothetical protein